MKNDNPRMKAKRFIGCGVIAAMYIATTSALADDVRASPVKAPQQSAKAPQKERNGADVRPVAIRLEGTLSFHTFYSVAITGGYAFNRWFALEGTLGWEGGLMYGAMGRLRVPVTNSWALSLGAGATGLWVSTKAQGSPPGTYAWLPFELGWEYREKEGFHFLIAASARVLMHARRDDPSGLCILCLEAPPMVFPAARFGIGWAF